jgi:hypothetical protein
MVAGMTKRATKKKKVQKQTDGMLNAQRQGRQKSRDTSAEIPRFSGF